MLSFFSFGQEDFLFFMFSMCSHQVFKVFPKFSMPLRHSQQHFTFNPILFGCGSTCKEWGLGGVGGGQEGSIFSLLCWGVPKNIGGGSIKWFLVGKKKDLGAPVTNDKYPQFIIAQSYHPWEYFWDFFITSIYYYSTYCCFY